MDILALIIFGAFIIFAFISGVSIGQRLNQNIEIKTPLQNIKTNITKVINKEGKGNSELETIASNIENYPYNQKEVKSDEK